MLEVRAAREASKRDKLDNLTALQPCCMVEVWSIMENVVWMRKEVVRREVHSVEVIW